MQKHVATGKGDAGGGEVGLGVRRIILSEAKEKGKGVKNSGRRDQEKGGGKKRERGGETHTHTEIHKNTNWRPSYTHKSSIKQTKNNTQKSNMP